MRFWKIAAVAGLAACATSADSTSETEQDVQSATPMGFARVTATGGIAASMNSSGGSVRVIPGTTGSYAVEFANLAGAWFFTDAAGGHAQVTAEGPSNVRCRIAGWDGIASLSSTAATVRVLCSDPGGQPAASPFAVLFYRAPFPAANSLPTYAAYSWVQANGGVSSTYDYNSSGAHNTVTRFSPGRYVVNIANASNVNASMMVSAFGNNDTICSVGSWYAGHTYVNCTDQYSRFVDSAFTFSYAVTGPTLQQQGAHTWFNGSSADPSYSAANPKVSGISTASIRASGGLPVVSLVVSGELGSWDLSPFVRASFATKYGSPGYCKVESVSSVEGETSSTSTTAVRCYTPDGMVINSPQLTFTQITSDEAGPG